MSCASTDPADIADLAERDNGRTTSDFQPHFVTIDTSPDDAAIAAHPLGAWEYPSMIAAAPLKPLRVFLEVGENDNGSTTAEDTHRNWAIANRNTAAALKEKGNQRRFMIAEGAGHCDDAARNQVVPEGMIWLWRGDEAP